MLKDRNAWAVERHNVLNNLYVLSEIERAGIQAIPFEGKSVVLKDQVTDFFEVTEHTVENHLEQNADAFPRNGCEVL